MQKRIEILSSVHVCTLSAGGQGHERTLPYQILKLLTKKRTPGI